MKIIRTSKHPFIEGTHCGLLMNYISENPALDLHRIRSLIENPNTGSILLIKGDEGNGRTHLLSGIGNELQDDKISFSLLHSESLKEIFNIRKRQFENYLETCSYCLVDSIEFILSECSQAYNWVKQILRRFLIKGGKLVLTAENYVTKEEICDFFKPVSVIEAFTTFPSFETSKKIAKIYVRGDIVDANVEIIYEKSGSIREFINLLICLEAKTSQQLTNGHL